MVVHICRLHRLNCVCLQRNRRWILPIAHDFSWSNDVMLISKIAHQQQRQQWQQYERKKMFHSSATNQNQWNVHKKTKFVATTFVRFVCIVSECVPVCERPFSWSNKHSLKWVNRANEIKQSKPSSSKAQQKKNRDKNIETEFLHIRLFAPFCLIAASFWLLYFLTRPSKTRARETQQRK